MMAHGVKTKSNFPLGYLPAPASKMSSPPSAGCVPRVYVDVFCEYLIRYK